MGKLLVTFLHCSVPLTGPVNAPAPWHTHLHIIKLTTSGLFTGFGTVLHRDRCATALSQFQLPGLLNCHL